MAELILKNVNKTFGTVEVIPGADLHIDDKEFVVFVGPSGCGKSTLLRLIAGLEDITSGELYIDGELVNDKPPRERGISMVFQSYALYPHMTVLQNMSFGLELAGASKAEQEQRVREAAQVLELEPLLERLPKQLSGGQRQRVAIGRAIVRNPRVFLFDEPLSNLDAALRVQMRIEIARLHERMGVTMIYVTHDQVEAMTLADKIVVLRAGHVEQVGPPLALYHHPQNRFVAGFIGSPQMNFIDAEVESVDALGVKVVLPGGSQVVAKTKGDGLAAGDRVVLGVRPEHLLETAGDATISGIVEVVEQLGESHFVYLRMADGALLTTRAAGDASLREGAHVDIGIPFDQCHLFRSDGSALERVRSSVNHSDGAIL